MSDESDFRRLIEGAEALKTRIEDSIPSTETKESMRALMKEMVAPAPEFSMDPKAIRQRDEARAALTKLWRALSLYRDRMPEELVQPFTEAGAIVLPLRPDLDDMLPRSVRHKHFLELTAVKEKLASVTAILDAWKETLQGVLTIAVEHCNERFEDGRAEVPAGNIEEVIKAQALLASTDH